MFRRKEEFENADTSSDLLSNVEDDVIETEKPAYAAPGNASAAGGEAPSQPASGSEAAAAGQSGAGMPKPGPAGNNPFRPSPAANMAASRVPMPVESRSAGAASGAAASNKNSKRVLTVGHDIHMKGEISTCDRLVIEGSVDATLKDVHTVELAQTGSFKGTAEIEDAEISGEFEGDLTVRGRLIIYSTGKVSGNLSYGEIEIERGGQISGNVETSGELESKQKKVA